MNAETSLTVRELFDEAALAYDGNRRQVIPCFPDLYGTLIRLIPFGPDEPFTVLDLGAGTGLVTALILKRFAGATATLLDISEGMLEKARQRFAGCANVTIRTGDYSTMAVEDSFDLIVSAMSVHHLEDFRKRLLVQKLHASLNPGGMFIHADLVKGREDETEAIYQAEWRRHIARTDIPASEQAKIYERMALDRPATLEAQLRWMEAAGFAGVDCYYKYFNFAVYAGRKTSDGK